MEFSGAVAARCRFRFETWPGESRPCRRRDCSEGVMTGITGVERGIVTLQAVLWAEGCGGDCRGMA